MARICESIVRPHKRFKGSVKEVVVSKGRRKIADRVYSIVNNIGTMLYWDVQTRIHGRVVWKASEADIQVLFRYPSQHFHSAGVLRQ